MDNFDIFKEFSNVASIFSSCYIILAPNNSHEGEEYKTKLLFVFAIFTLVLCVAEVILRWFLSDKIFQDHRLVNTKKGLLSIILLVRGILSLFYLMFTTFLYSSLLYWILFTLVAGNMVLTAIGAAFKEVESVRAKRKNEVRRISLTIIDYLCLTLHGLVLLLSVTLLARSTALPSDERTDDLYGVAVVITLCFIAIMAIDILLYIYGIDEDNLYTNALSYAATFSFSMISEVAALPLAIIYADTTYWLISVLIALIFMLMVCSPILERVKEVRAEKGRECEDKRKL